MDKDLKISLYIPCRNESQNLEKVAARIPAFIDEVIIVSNKSTDNTVEKAKELGFKVFEDNRTSNGIGYGFAHMTGIKEATGDIIISIDGDAQHPVEKLEHIVKYMLLNELDFLYCSRYPLSNKNESTFKQRLGVFLLNLEVRVLYGIKLNDVLSGMWLMKSDVKEKLNLTEGDWNLSPQIKINAARHPEIKFGEYNISQHKRTAGKTHQNYFKTGFEHMKWILKNRFIPAKQESTYDQPKFYFKLG